MKQTLVAILAGLSLVVSPTLAAAQSVSVTRSILDDLPYTLIFPEPMVVAGGTVEPVSVTINHPEAPLQCDMRVVPPVVPIQGAKMPSASASFQIAAISSPCGSRLSVTR